MSVAGLKPGLPPWGRNVRFRRVQILVRRAVRWSTAQFCLALPSHCDLRTSSCYRYRFSPLGHGDFESPVVHGNGNAAISRVWIGQIWPRRHVRVESVLPHVDGLSWRDFFTCRLVGRPCVRPQPAVHMTAGHNALRDQVLIKSAFDNARGSQVVLIAGSTGSALSAVRPPTSHHARCPARSQGRARWVLCSAHPWPSWPRPSVRSAMARWRRPWSASAPTMP